MQTTVVALGIRVDGSRETGIRCIRYQSGIENTLPLAEWTSNRGG